MLDIGEANIISSSQKGHPETIPAMLTVQMYVTLVLLDRL